MPMYCIHIEPTLGAHNSFKQKGNKSKLIEITTNIFNLQNDSIFFLKFQLNLGI